MLRKIIPWLLAFTLFITCSYPAVAQQIDHSKLDRILSHAVDEEGGVDYAGIIEHRNLLDEYLKDMLAQSPQKLPDIKEKLAYWLNVYNAQVLQSIIDHWPMKSVLQFDKNAFFETWSHPTAVGSLTLNQIESDILRKEIKDPRIHIGLNCGSRGCPPLTRKAYTGGNVVGLLDEQSKRFVNDPRFNRLDFQTGKAHLSSIFKWYADDFQAVGGVLAFIKVYSTAPQKDQIPTLKIDYIEYDWNLNAQLKR